MPFFAKDDISAVHAPNAGVVHLDSHHDYDDARDDSFLAHKPLAASINRRFDHTEPPHEVFDDTSSTDSSTRQPHMDGNLPQALPNGVQSSRSHSAMLTNGGAGNPLKPAVDGMQHPTSVNGTSSISYSQQHQQPQSSGRVYPEFSHLRNSGPPQGIREDLQAGASSLQTRSPAAPTHAPPPVPSVASMVPSDSTNPPIPGGLRSRHTLDVPRPQPGRSSLSKENNNADTAYATGRFSPTVGNSAGAGVGGRRASLSLGRRNTRSVHSELPREDVVLDDEASRWAEAYRQKRAKRRRKDEDEDEDKVLVGTKVDENHANFTTAYNMLTGIRVSVSRTNAKLDRPLTDADFETKQKSTFDITGNELVPSAKYDFKFKDYAPWVFRHLRALFRIDPADYLMSLTGKYILSELGSPGKSGSFFYFSRDYKYIIKTIHHGEHKFLRKILKEYYNHATDNPNTLLSQFYGLHRVKTPYGRKIHFVVMNNLFPPHRDIHTTFDLKGSSVGRDYKEEDLEKNPRATLKDLNWLRRKRHLELGLEKKHLFVQQLERDVRLMQKLGIMDYSLLIGVHDLRKGNDENLREKTLQVFNPGGDTTGDEPSQVLMRTPSKLENARKAKELRQMIKAERPVPVGETMNRMPDILEQTHTRGLFYSDDGGIRATHEDNQPAEEIYYLGVIDCLTHYGVVKKFEHFWKGLSNDRTQISARPPHEYGERFLSFMTGITMSSEEAARDAHDREAAAIANPNAGPPIPSSPSYLPPAPPHMRSPGSPEPNPVVEKVLQVASRADKDSGAESQLPERKISTSIPLPGRTSSNTILPVVEESVEGSSSGVRPYTPQERADGYTDLAPGGFGGRGPPTPPKSSYVESAPGRARSGSGSDSFHGKLVDRTSLDKALPPLPR
ncbi:1-phosphatidylinositol-4-phosphate 5-kinase [Microdochium nivale]|nr:1-phosphatidylinositol-4-phosphate 5-kinase [Microdochium nivale]